MKTALVLFLALLATAGPACAARWKPVKLSHEQSIYVDVEALVRSGNTVQAWDWQKFDSPQTSANLQSPFFWVKSLTNYHCVRRTTDAVLKIYFGSDGVEIKRVHLEGLQFPAAVEPDSLREKLLETACNPPKPGAKSPAVAMKPDASPESKAMADAGDVLGKPMPAKKTADKPQARKAIRPALADAGSAAQIMRPIFKRTYTLPPLTSPRDQKGGAVAKVAKSKRKQLALCPPQTAAGKSAAAQPTSQLTDAGNDGLFN
ncbi:MAG: surface-adhesin E family protein [Betaproteobacteria bacterium]